MGCIFIVVRSLCTESIEPTNGRDLNGFYLKGSLAPELGKLIHLRSLILYKNHFSGIIPKEIGGLTMLELLDLRDNNLSGRIPAEIGRMLSLRRLLLGDNKFEGSIPVELWKLNLLSELQIDGNLTSALATRIGCINRKFGHCIWQSSLKRMNKANSFIGPIKGTLRHYFNALQMFKFGKGSLHGHRNKYHNNVPSSSDLHVVQNVPNPAEFVRRRLLEQASNLPAAPATGGSPPGQITSLPTTRSSGAFPAIPNGKNKSHVPAPESSTNPPLQKTPKTPSSQSSTDSAAKQATGTSGNSWKYYFVIPGVFVLLIVSVAMICICRRRGVTTIGPWKTGLSGQLQKAFVTGVPKLNRAELETACEDFSNIIDTLDDCTVYKGTLSSGVEIAVASTSVASSKDWSKRSEITYRKKIDSLSRVNHKNFVNLIGYCEEDEPFIRMMVFEYAPSGSLFEHLHVKEMEHLDWNARTRIIMGTAYCLQYMHHDLNPPVAHSNLNSTAIYLTDDYAAKIAEIGFWKELASKSKLIGEDGSEHSDLPPYSDPESNVYSFGILLLEIISGKLPYSEELGSLVKWASAYLNDKRSISYLIDPSLKSFKNNELDVICEVIQDCIQPDTRQRATMREITSKLREVIAISPDAATPRLSPLWWAELEILSVEAT
ncbi:protein MALE DISCOVERER 2-like isoform X2 [Malania oleifera]|uniref:protein MALE DISCOVERER 2-like isoform X2 n=1 Tax=Malania oleifera TaxID=397392 RepID=UPI0025AE5D32|nr:protein MALE DISCOVERER 2-like isoform X2 [Malania oleifera]